MNFVARGAVFAATNFGGRFEALYAWHLNVHEDGIERRFLQRRFFIRSVEDFHVSQLLDQPACQPTNGIQTLCCKARQRW